MARPQKETVDYFPHDSRASDGTTLTILDSKFGNDGYSFWFRLLERLSATPGHFIDCRNPAVWEFLQAKTHLNEDIVSSLLKLLAELGAIDKELWDSKIIWCQNLVDNVADVYKNRRTNTPQKPNTDGRNPTPALVSTGENPTPAVVSTDESTQSKVKETKVDKIKVNRTRVATTVIPVGKWHIEELWVNDFHAELIATGWAQHAIEDEIKRCIDYWDDQDKKGKKSRSPKNALRNWFNSEAALKRKKRDARESHADNDPNRFVGGKYGHMVRR